MIQQNKDQLLLDILNILPEDFFIRQVKSVVVINQENSQRKPRLIGNKRFEFSDSERFFDFEEKALDLVKNAGGATQNQIKNLLSTLAPHYQIGNQLQEIKGLEHITLKHDGTFTVEEQTFSPQLGTVYLLNIWATWKQSSQYEMNKLERMLEQNPKWQGIVKIIGISLDEQSDIKINKWKSIDHYRIIKGQDDRNHFLQYLHLTSPPYVLLINKWGKIVYKGNPYLVDLKAKIEEQILTINDISQNLIVELKQEQLEESLNKEEFQQLKKEIKNLESGIYEAEIDGFIEIKLEKTSVWKKNCQKLVENRSKLQLSYQINEPNQFKFNQILEKYWKKIPQHLRVIKEAKIINLEETFNQIKEKFQETFFLLGVNIIYCEQENFQVIYDQQQFMVKNDKDIGVQVDNLDLNLYSIGLEQLDDYLKSIKIYDDDHIREFVDKLTQGLRKHITLGFGDQFEIINDYQFWNKKDAEAIKHEKDQILLIVYWVDWCDKCKKVLKNTIELFQQNKQKWGDNVKFVFLCLQPFVEVKDKLDVTYQQSNLFYFPIEYSQIDVKKYRVDFPHTLIVDKYGFIRKTGKVDNVEELIDSLLNENIHLGEIKINSENFIKTKQLLENQDIKQSLIDMDPQKILQFEILLKQINSESYFKIEKPELTYFIRDNQVQQMEKILNKLFSIIPQPIWNIQKTISKTLSIPYPGLICAVCKNELQPQQYYSPFKQEYVCTECAEYDDTSKSGLERYKYHDTLVFINGPLSDLSVLNNIDFHKIGTNRKLKEDEEVEKCHYMICNGCDGEGIQGPRYISINSKIGRLKQGGYVDFCKNCFFNLKDKTSERAKEIVAKESANGMIIDSLFTRVLFNYGSYGEF